MTTLYTSSAVSPVGFSIGSTQLHHFLILILCQIESVVVAREHLRRLTGRCEVSSPGLVLIASERIRTSCLVLQCQLFPARKRSNSRWLSQLLPLQPSFLGSGPRVQSKHLVSCSTRALILTLLSPKADLVSANRFDMALKSMRPSGISL